MDTSCSRPELEFLARRAGLTLTEEQTTELLVVYDRVRAMAERVRQPRGRAAEPAHIFVARSAAP